MPIISVRDNENKKWKRKTKKGKQRDDASCSESVRAKWLCCAFKLGFFQIICKDSFNF